MKLSRKIIRRVLYNYSSVIEQIHRDGMTLDDFSDADVVDMIHENMR